MASSQGAATSGDDAAGKNKRPAQPASPDLTRYPKRRQNSASAVGTAGRVNQSSAPRQTSAAKLREFRHTLVSGTLNTREALKTYRTDCSEDDMERGLRVHRYQQELNATPKGKTALAEDTGVLNSAVNPAVIAAHKTATREAARPPWITSAEYGLLRKAVALKPGSFNSAADYLGQLGVSETELQGVVKKQIGMGNSAAINAWNNLGNAFLAEGNLDGAVGSHLTGLQICRELSRFDLAVKIGEHMLQLTRRQPENNLLLQLEVARDKLDAGVGLDTVKFHLQQVATSPKPEDQCHVLAEMGRLHVMFGNPKEGARLMFASLNRSRQLGIPPHERLTAWVANIGQTLLDEALEPEDYEAAFAAGGNGDQDLIRMRSFVAPVLRSNG
jgi:hypothetical protein